MNILFFVVIQTSLVISQALKPCNSEILRSYGFTGQPTPKLLVMEMCPMIKLTCCTKRDQLTFYGNWHNDGTLTSLKQHYDNINRIYSEFVKQLEKVEQWANTIRATLHDKKIANCKLMANRIMNYSVSSIVEQIQINLEKQSKFFIDTFKGFFCTICDYQNHDYFVNNQYILS